MLHVLINLIDLLCACQCKPQGQVVGTPEGAISYPEFSGSLASSWSPGETLGYWNFIMAGFLRQTNASCHAAANQKI